MLELELRRRCWECSKFVFSWLVEALQVFLGGQELQNFSFSAETVYRFAVES